jgi:ligand-binding SRPBCC domain-containing protein
VHAPYFFTDESKVDLPFGMRYWKHVHRVVPIDNQTCRIEEDVTWESSNWWIGFILNLGFWLMMRGRRKMYQKYFEKNAFGVDMK